jgi:hypothetical protein
MLTVKIVEDILFQSQIETGISERAFNIIHHNSFPFLEGVREKSFPPAAGGGQSTLKCAGRTKRAALRLQHFTLETVACRQAVPAYANLAGIAVLRSATPEHFIGIDIFNDEML